MELRKSISRLLWVSVLVQGMAVLMLALLVLFQESIKRAFSAGPEICATFTLPYSLLVNVLYQLAVQAVFAWGALRGLREQNGRTGWETAGIVLSVLPAFFQWAVDSVTLNLLAAQSVAAVNSYQVLKNASAFFMDPIHFLGKTVFLVGLGMSIGWKWRSRGAGAPVSRLPGR